MRRFRVAFVLFLLTVLLAAAGPVTARAAGKTKVINFKGSFSGTASLLISGSSVKIVSVNGKGPATLLGTSTLSGTGTGTSSGSSSCAPWKGTGSIKSSAGAINLSASTSSAKGCSSGSTGPVTVTVTGKAKATGGTGKTKGATGTLSFNGKLHLKNTKGSQSGKFTASISGKLTVS